MKKKERRKVEIYYFELYKFEIVKKIYKEKIRFQTGT